MDFSTISNQIGKMAFYSHPLIKTAASGFGLATFASISANWLLPAVQIRHFSHSKKVTVFLASLTTLFLTLYKTLNKDNKKEEVTTPNNKEEVTTPNNKEEVTTPNNKEEVFGPTADKTNSGKEGNFKFIYNEEDAKKYIENSCGMKELHRKLVKGADLERIPSLTRFVNDGTTLTILNYTDKETKFTENGYFDVDKCRSGFSFNFKSSELIVYQLCGDDETIFIESKAIYSKHCGRSMILQPIVKIRQFERLKNKPLITPTDLESSLKPTIYKIIKIDKEISFKMVVEDEEREIPCLKFKASQFAKIRKWIPASQSLTYVDYTKRGLTLLPFLLTKAAPHYSKGLLKLTAYPAASSKKYYRKVEYLWAKRPIEEVHSLSRTFKEQWMEWRGYWPGGASKNQFFDNREARKQLMVRNHKKPYLFLQQLKQMHGMTKDVLQIVSSLYYKICIKEFHDPDDDMLDSPLFETGFNEAIFIDKPDSSYR